MECDEFGGYYRQLDRRGVVTTELYSTRNTYKVLNREGEEGDKPKSSFQREPTRSSEQTRSKDTHVYKENAGCGTEPSH